MILFRLLLLIAVAFLLYRLWQLISEPTRKSGGSAPVDGEAVVACDYCAVHVPSHEVLRLGQRCFCCEKHRDAYLEEHED